MALVRRIRLATVDPPLKVTARRGQAAPVVTGGYGGWEEVPRPRRVALTVWKGNSPLRMTVPLLLDGFRAGSSVENACATLERMATPQGVREAPPVVSVNGSLPHTEKRWVIDNDGLEWGEGVYSSKGHRIRQEVTVHLLQYIPEDRVTTNNAAGIVRSRSDATVRTYTVKSGDTLSSIAAKLLGDYRRWPEIADLNNLRDPNLIYPGQKLLVPLK